MRNMTYGLLPHHISIPRNYLLCDVFYKAGLIESWGSGTLKVVKLCKEAGLKEPEFEQNRGFFGITFYEDTTKNVVEK